MRRALALPAAVAVIAALAAPAPAPAASNTTSYVVTLRSELGAPCERAITEVTNDLAVTPTAVYTSSVCGFAALLSKAQARAAAADPRVESVTVDQQFGAA
jgi:aqualysin 1